MLLRRMPAVILPLCCGPLYASDQPTELDPIIVTATRLETPFDQIPASVSVVEGEEIERQQITDTLEALRDIPGVTIVQTGSRGSQTSLFVRGGEADFNQVLIDGVKVNEPGGAFDFSDLTTDGLDRIEMVRGPQSALYGSDAVTSVVQLFTRRGDGPLAARLGFVGGSFETFEEHAGISGGTERYGYAIDVGRIDTDGILDINNRYGNTTVASRFDVLEKLGPGTPHVIFVSGYDRHAVRAFDVDALDYLVKPVDKDRLRRSVMRAVTMIRTGSGALVQQLGSLIGMLSRAASEPLAVRIAVRDDHRIRLVEVGDIDWIQATDKVAVLHVGKRNWQIRESLASLERRLDPERFIRVHRSAIVNIARIDELQPWAKGDYFIRLRDGTRLTTGPAYRQNVQRLLRGLSGR
ncbi:MAG: TonB-dependent receptor plug domain-containing protein [Gemmatimonadetes bacterium]|nr:TonB-dependent receptor plug domain-containing protein [Gemmatimonadota bacterium]